MEITPSLGPLLPLPHPQATWGLSSSVTVSSPLSLQINVLRNRINDNQKV